MLSSVLPREPRPGAAVSSEVRALQPAACPICGAGATRLFVRSNDRDVLRCSSCRLLFSSPRPSQREMAEFFASEYIGNRRRVEIDFAALREPTLRREAALVRRLLPEGGRLLDVGCAAGAFLRLFAGDPRWVVAGVEPSRFAAEYARSTLGLNVYTGFLREQRLPASSLEAITSLDTFYFHPEPNEDLAEIARLLVPGGLLFMEIPGLRFRLLKNSGLLARLRYGESARLNAALHLFFYSAATLARLARPHGLRLVARYPQQGPIYGSLPLRLVNAGYFRLSAFFYRLSGGRLHLAPKELLVLRRAGAEDT